MNSLLILRPQPGADETAARARAKGLNPVVAPLFTIRPLAWTPPDPGAFDAIVLTSANAVRSGGSGLTSFLHLPCYAVGEATATAARDAGFADIRTGPSDSAALARIMATDGILQVFHPCGRDHVPLSWPGISVSECPVYAAEAAERLSAEAIAAAEAGAIALIHSPRAGALFARLADALRSKIHIAAISPAAALAAGEGWKDILSAPAPRDDALLELAAKLCQTGPQEGLDR